MHKMHRSKRAFALTAIATVSLVAAGCSGGGDEDTGNEDATANASITINGTQPEVGLVPGNTSETGGGNIVDHLWTGLITYPPGGGEPENAVAESIDTTDSQNYTVKIKKGTKFHDGTEVKAKNFVDAWNYTALSTNGQQQASFFSDIEGFADVHPEDPDGEGPQEAPEPKAQTMSGLAAVDDYTFTIKLQAPFSIFKSKLGFAAYSPMPDVFFQQGPDTFGRNPIGNGPVKFVSWQDDVDIRLARFDEYTLADKVKVKEVTVKLYQEDTAAYADLQSNHLDFMQQVPVVSLAGEKWKSDLGDRAIDIAIPVQQMISFPIYDARFKNPDLRKAISLAINREEIASKVFFNSRKPATSWAAPGTPGAEQFACTACSYNKEEAVALLQKAGGFSGRLVFSYNADASHKDWMEAVAQSVKNTLGIDAVAQGVPTFSNFRQLINARKMTGPYRAAWQADYPSAENWVGPLYVKGAASNDGQYDNADVNRLYGEGTKAATVEEAYAKFAEAIKIVDAEVPSMPIVAVSQQSGISDRLKPIKTDWVGVIDLSSVELK
ncbi:peptide ABC transporter substrate-binding protein [Phytohabitans houttuyneae]|uniref:Peptide ABC transporter substrate-binding protein n=1 Tax=Phytohabitans houttuyneae TaxID=1076126 RepID=A0A6V8K0M8_9ACTN|nr:ABC transporter substrate-binding protein [Phytohabitans houttuyneae]GFJ77120.1 peptide ABC transporter substrate-binding protein [Phytohabitans houttuyneae]